MGNVLSVQHTLERYGKIFVNQLVVNLLKFRRLMDPVKLAHHLPKRLTSIHVLQITVHINRSSSKQEYARLVQVVTKHHKIKEAVSSLHAKGIRSKHLMENAKHATMVRNQIKSEHNACKKFNHVLKVTRS